MNMLSEKRPKGYNHFEPGHLPADMRVVIELQHLIEMNFRVKHTAEFYARKLGYTVKRINALTMAYFDSTVYAMVQERVHAEALKLLCHSRLTVKEITYNLGISDASWFCRCFRKKEGITPMSYRSKFLTDGGLSKLAL